MPKTAEANGRSGITENICCVVAYCGELSLLDLHGYGKVQKVLMAVDMTRLFFIFRGKVYLLFECCLTVGDAGANRLSFRLQIKKHQNTGEKLWKTRYLKALLPL